MHRFVASGLGVGLIPRRLWGSDSGAGTVGSLLAAAVAWAGADLSIWVHIGLPLIAIVASVWSATPFASGNEDPGWIVIDEEAGALIALAGLSGWAFVVAWLVFRAADISKRFPGVAAAERLHGAVGITADDVIAGLYGLGAGWLVTVLA